MSQNLLKTFDEKVKPGLFEEMKRERPLTDKVIYQHLTIIHASILGGLIKKSKNPNGSKAIKNLIEKGNHDGGIINRIPEIFGHEEKLSDTKKLGNSLLAFVFDEGTDKGFEKIQHFLSEKYRTTQEDLIEVNRMIAPFSMGLIGRIVHDQEMTEEQVSKLLIENEPYINQRFPGLAKVLGIESQAVPDSDQASPEPTDPAAEKIPVDSPTVKENGNSPADPSNEGSDEGRKLFLKSLWPWLLVLVISGLSLFLLKKYQSEPKTTNRDNPFNFIQNDSIIVSNENTHTLPGNVLLKVDKNSSVDSLLKQLENNRGHIDTLWYLNMDIGFQDSTAIITSSANKELANILSILQSYPDLKMDINIFYDSIYLAKNPATANQQIENLQEYFMVFGLNKSRFKINSYERVPKNYRFSLDGENRTKDSIQKMNESPIVKDKNVELLFYRDQPLEVDSSNIQK